MNNLFKEVLNGAFINNNIPGGAVAEAVKARISPNIALVKKHGVKLVAYEAGQHLLRVDGRHVIKDQKIFEMFKNAQTDPRMLQAYRQYMQAWKRSGADIMMHFRGIGQNNNHEYFHMLERPENPNSVKYRALTEYLRQR